MSSESSNSTIYGVPTKYVSLVTLVVQNSALVLSMRYSRILPGPRYLSSTAVVISELLKCIICLAIHLHEQCTKPQSPELPLLSDSSSISSSCPSSKYTLHQLCTDIFSTKSGFLKLLIPAVLYTLQNNLQFVAASNLDAATFQVTYQCKILTTALFAVLLLRQSLTLTKWVSLLILTLGVACVQIPSGANSTTQTEGNYFVGLIAVAVACLCSGFAGVYFEKVLKTSSTNTSLWIRNIQLSVGCLSIALAGTLAWDGKAIATHGFFYGYNAITVITICIQAAGGLIVALVIKYADNILKGFATSLSIILSTVASVFVFSFVVTRFFLMGSVLVFFATYLYSKPVAKEEEKVTKAVDSSEKSGEEAMPMLVVDDYDEKMQEGEEERGFCDEMSFRDESSDLEAGSMSSRESSPERGDGEGRGKNFTPSLLQKGFDKGEEVCHELGHVS